MRAIDDDAAPVGRDHPETAKAAAAKALPNTGTRKRLAYDFIGDQGGLTAEEVGTAFGWPHQTYSAAVSTLVRDGHLVDSGRRRLTRAGNPAIVYIIAVEVGQVWGQALWRL